LLLFFSSCRAHHRLLHSFPTRRSSDLPLLVYLMVCLATYSPSDPGWSNAGSLTAPLNNAGGRVGAWTADVLLGLFGHVAFVLPRSEEHTSELQSRENLVRRLLLEKKKQ